jgi:hypothetical protein
VFTVRKCSHKLLFDISQCVHSSEGPLCSKQKMQVSHLCRGYCIPKTCSAWNKAVFVSGQACMWGLEHIALSSVVCSVYVASLWWAQFREIRWN